MIHLKATDSSMARTRWLLVVDGLRPMREAHALGSFRGAFGKVKYIHHVECLIVMNSLTTLCETAHKRGTIILKSTMLLLLHMVLLIHTYKVSSQWEGREKKDTLLCYKDDQVRKQKIHAHTYSFCCNTGSYVTTKSQLCVKISSSLHVQMHVVLLHVTCRPLKEGTKHTPSESLTL